MELSTEQVTIIALLPVAIRDDLEKVESLSVRRLDSESGFESVGVVTARIVGNLMVSHQKVAA